MIKLCVIMCSVYYVIYNTESRMHMQTNFTGFKKLIYRTVMHVVEFAYVTSVFQVHMFKKKADLGFT